MTAFFQLLARGLYTLPSNWKSAADRRLNLSGILATLILLNFISVATGVEFALAYFGCDIDLTTYPIVIFLMIAVWSYTIFRVVTYEFFIEISREQCRAKMRQQARKALFIYFAISISAFVAVVIWAAIIGRPWYSG